METINKGFYELKENSTMSDIRDSTAQTKGDMSGVENKNIAYLFNREDIIEAYLESVTLQNSGLKLLRKQKALVRQDHESLIDTVKLLSGGSTSSDPLYSGFIGPGMLTGAVFGYLKKSPSSSAILEVLRVLSYKNKTGILVIVLNNLANRLNFGLACQKAAREGIKTLCVNVGEDVSGVSVSKSVGRRGLSGIIFLYKIAGAMSAEKRTLYEIHHVIEKLKGNCLGSVSVGIQYDMITIGPGSKGDKEKVCFLWDTFDYMKETARLEFIVKHALSHLFHPSSYFSLHIVKGDDVVIIVNNLGNLTDFHLILVVKEILDQMKSVGIKVVRVYSGRFLNSNKTGFSVSVLKVKENILELLDYPVKVTSWPYNDSGATTKPNVFLDLPATSSLDTHIDKTILGPKFTKQQAGHLVDILPRIAETIENMKEYLDDLDRDHDFGSTITKFTRAINHEIDTRKLQISTPFEFLEHLSDLAGTTMGGVAGGVFSVLLSAAAQVFVRNSSETLPDLSMWVEAARAARDSLYRFTRVKPGDGTILDALNPFVESFTDVSVKSLSKQVSSAMKGARDSATSERGPDPGAICLATVIRVIFNCIQIDLAEAEAYKEARPAKQLSGLIDDIVQQIEDDVNDDN